jgi:phosphoribosylformimino-5-aminoimidazole carboxamide ribotide isomerase
MGRGVDVTSARRLVEEAGLDVIASGGVASLHDVRQVRAAALNGVIIGRALYEGQIALREALLC